MKDKDILKRLHIFIGECGGQAKAARRLHISQTYLSLVVCAHRPITKGIAERLGYRQVIMYKETV